MVSGAFEAVAVCAAFFFFLNMAALVKEHWQCVVNWYQSFNGRVLVACDELVPEFS